MLKDLIKHIATETGLTQARSRAALGIILNCSERQGSEFPEQLYRKLPGARTLAAKAGDSTDAASGVIARLIEQTPGGRMAVASRMIRSLQNEGLGHSEIGKLFPVVSAFCQKTYGLEGFGHLGDLLGGGDAHISCEAMAA